MVAWGQACWRREYTLPHLRQTWGMGIKVRLTLQVDLKFKPYSNEYQKEREVKLF